MKKYIVMSIATAFVLSSVSADDLKNVPMAKIYPAGTDAKSTITTTQKVVTTKVEEVKPAVDYSETFKAYDKKIGKLEKNLKKLKKQLTAVKKHDATDNIKWNVDFRTSVDSIEYKTASGKTRKNSSVLANRLWLNMAYAPTENMIFKGRISYNKAYGAAPTNTATGFPQRGYGYDAFDWVLNENLLDDKLRVKEAYWLYMSDSLLGSDVSWTASFGRRPSSTGFLAHFREGDKPSSPIGHTINMEFDGASFRFGLDQLTGIDGMSWKLCLGRGLTNSRSRFNMDGGFASMGDYAKDPQTLKDIDLAGFIFVPFDNGQYKIMTNYYRGFNVPGFVMADANMFTSPTTNTGMVSLGDTGMAFNPNLSMKNLGDMDGAVASILVDGIGDGISDFLDDTKFFASFAWSKSMPDNKIASMSTALSAQVAQAGGAANMLAGLNQQIGQAMAGGATQAQVMQGMEQQMAGTEGMLGSNDDETGTSYWVGLQWPCLLVDGAKVGAEYNHGSKYWRPFTYAEDTLAGSKIAARGDAYEFYWSKEIVKALTMQIRYTKINYDYTGSQGFFGAGGAPMTMAEAKGFGMDPIEEAEDIRISLRYRF